MRDDALLEAACGLDRLDVEKPLFQLVDRGLSGGRRKGLLQPAPEPLGAAVGVVVKALAVALAWPLALLEHSPHHLIRAGSDELLAERGLCLLDDPPRK